MPRRKQWTRLWLQSGPQKPCLLQTSDACTWEAWPEHEAVVLTPAPRSRLPVPLQSPRAAPATFEPETWAGEVLCPAKNRIEFATRKPDPWRTGIDSPDLFPDNDG